MHWVLIHGPHAGTPDGFQSHWVLSSVLRVCWNSWWLLMLTQKKSLQTHWHQKHSMEGKPTGKIKRELKAYTQCIETIFLPDFWGSLIPTRPSMCLQEETWRGHCFLDFSFRKIAYREWHRKKRWVWQLSGQILKRGIQGASTHTEIPSVPWSC